MKVVKKNSPVCLRTTIIHVVTSSDPKMLTFSAKKKKLIQNQFRKIIFPSPTKQLNNFSATPTKQEITKYNRLISLKTLSRKGEKKFRKLTYYHEEL
jgi:hypothetical protein